MKRRFPSTDNSNPLTWKCKLFGCRNEVLTTNWYEDSEKHGINNSSYTAATLIKRFSLKGCLWCFNLHKILEEEKIVFPVWHCSCDICESV